MSRHQITEQELLAAVELAKDKLLYRFRQKGAGIFVSNHEILGVVSQELSEYEEAVHRRLPADEKIGELLDVAVGAIFGVASIQSGKMDW